jgi:hypothetical protein
MLEKPDDVDDDLCLPRAVLRLSSPVLKHPNLRMCDMCGRTYCIVPDSHETTLTISRHVERCHPDEM